MLIAVAIVAVDCAVVRWLNQLASSTDMLLLDPRPFVFTRDVPEHEVVLELALGVLPLANIAVIGVLRWAGRRSWLMGDDVGVATRRGSVAGVTFFSVQFVLLAIVAARYAPDIVGPFLREALDEAARRSTNQIANPDELLRFIEVATILGVVVSGPALLISWAGGMLANRWAATKSRDRFYAMAGLLSLIFACADLKIGLRFRPFDDQRTVSMEIRILDSETERPLTGARVVMTDAFVREANTIDVAVLTDASGRARLAGRFASSGGRNAFHEVATFSTWGHWLSISAPGYATRRLSLTEVVRPLPDVGAPVTGTVALRRGDSASDRFGDVAGSYLSIFRWAGGDSMVIQPDGRFAWSSGRICPDQPYSMDYGDLKRREHALRFVPIPHFDRESDPRGIPAYRAVRWGDGVYLCVDDPNTLAALCRAAIIQHIPSRSRRLTDGVPRCEFIRGTLLRVSDQGKPRRGWPDLPLEVWVRYLTSVKGRAQARAMARLGGTLASPWGRDLKINK
jgi:hypothetical protein